MAKPQEKVSFGTRLKQIGQVFSFTAKQDKWFVPLLLAAVLIPLALTVFAVYRAYVSERQRHEKLAVKYGGETWGKTLAKKQQQAAQVIVQLMDRVKEEQA